MSAPRHVIAISLMLPLRRAAFADAMLLTPRFLRLLRRRQATRQHAADGCAFALMPPYAAATTRHRYYARHVTFATPCCRHVVLIAYTLFDAFIATTPPRCCFSLLIFAPLRLAVSYHTLAYAALFCCRYVTMITRCRHDAVYMPARLPPLFSRRC